MAFKIIPLAIFLLVSYLLAINVANATIGINWGRQNAQRLLPSNVVDLVLQNEIRQARLFTSEEDMLRAFGGSGVDITVTISTSDTVNNDGKASWWVQMRQPYFNPSNIRQVYIADFAFTSALAHHNKAFINDAMQAMKCLQHALKDAGYGDVKVTIPHNKAVLKLNKTSLRPSEAEFVDEIKPEMTTFLHILKENNASFVFSLNPITDIVDFGLDLNFAIPDNKSTLVVRDVNGTVYTNVFELMHDSFAWALKKLHATNVKLTVGQVGWPTDGYVGANATMAERFYKALLPFVSTNTGTPMRPNATIDIYIQALTDENMMPFYGDSSFTRHWGIYRSNGKPKYMMDLTGQGRDNVYPAEAKGIKLMPERWCVFNGDRSDIGKVRRQFEHACAKADCTALAPGGSCSHLDFVQNITYAFNKYFQFQYQNETQCDFEGLGHVSTEDPSTRECMFPVEVVKLDQRAYGQSSAGNRFHDRRPIDSVIILFLLSILGTLFWN